MALVVCNSLSFMTDSDLQAMASYLKAIPTDSALRTGRQDPDSLEVQGANLYVQYCVGCHQSSGRGAELHFTLPEPTFLPTPYRNG